LAAAFRTNLEVGDAAVGPPHVVQARDLDHPPDVERGHAELAEPLPERVPLLLILGVVGSSFSIIIIRFVGMAARRGRAPRKRTWNEADGSCARKKAEPVNNASRDESKSSPTTGACFSALPANSDAKQLLQPLIVTKGEK
jgi:hypothetical protein